MRDGFKSLKPVTGIRKQVIYGALPAARPGWLRLEPKGGTK